MTHIKRIFRIDEAAEILGVSERTIRRYIDDGRLEAFRLSSSSSPLRVTSDAIDAYIETQKEAFVTSEA